MVAHPGAQYSYEAAFALQEAGLLHSYLTGIYYRPDSVWCRALATIKPIKEGLVDRRKDGLAPQLVYLFPFGELCHLSLVRLRPFAKRAGQIIRWRNRRFDKIVERTIRFQKPAGIICYDTCALRAFKAAADLGALCILDQSIGHVRTAVQLMREESELHPEFADSMPIDLPEWFLAQCSAEALLADVILIGSQYARDTMVAHGVDASRIAIVPYGADIERFRPAPHRHAKRFRVLFVGQLSQRKGIKYLLEAVRALAIPELELVLVGGVVGSGSGLVPYRDHFKHIPNVPHVDVQKYFQNADLFVYPSLHEGSAIAIYEALASGLPVITTANSGSVVRDGSEGFIVPIRDIAALKDKILLLYENRKLREEMGRNARALATQFTWQAYRTKLCSLVKDTLARVAGTPKGDPANKSSAVNF
jgi:alpha-maltose-1-phosphate synthase